MTNAAERTLRLAAYADAHRAGFTLDDVARDVPGYPPVWEAMRKAVRRDAHDLAAGFGIRLDYDEADHRYSVRAAFLTPRERHALLAAVGLVAVDDGTEAPLGELGSGIDDHDAVVLVRVHEHVARLRSAIGERAAVAFRYSGRDRTVEPYALGRWRDRWYLAGHDRGADGLRRFRLDRIVDLAAAGPPADGPGGYEIPAGFDADAAFRLDPNAWGHDPPLDALVLVDPDFADQFAAEFGATEVERDADRVCFALTVRDHRSFGDRLFAFRTHARVTEPAELRDALRDRLLAIVEHP